MELVY